MRIALDTNILAAVLSGQRPIADILTRARRDGDVLIVSGLVYLEILAYPQITRDLRDDFLADTEILVELDLPQEAWELASEAYLSHTQRWQRSGGRRRSTGDFLVAAHALLRADTFFTLDAELSEWFPNLRLLPNGLAPRNQE